MQARTQALKNSRQSEKKADSSRANSRGRGKSSGSRGGKQTHAVVPVTAPSSSQYDEEFWESLIQQLISQPYPDQSLQKEEAASILVLIAELLPKGSSQLSIKFCELLVLILRKQEVAFHLAAELEEISNRLLPLISPTRGQIEIEPSTRLLQLEALKALSFLVFERGWLLLSKFGKIVDVLLALVDESQNERDVFRMTVNCLGNLCAKTGTKAAASYPPIFEKLSLKFSRFSSDILAHSGQQNLGKTVSSILRALQLVILEGKTLHEPQVPSLLSSLTKLMYYGTPNLPLPPPPPLSAGEYTGGSSRTSPASSDYSGSDANGGDRFNAWKVRLHALGCLQSIAKCSGAKLVPFWPSLLPQSAQQASICSIMVSDPVHQVRTAASVLSPKAHPKLLPPF